MSLRRWSLSHKHIVSRRSSPMVWLVAATAVSVVAAAPVVVGALAADGGSTWQYPVRAEAVNVVPGPVSTTSTTFTGVPNLDLLDVASRGPASITFSAKVSGGPVIVRVLRDGRPTYPGGVRLAGSADPTGASYTFVAGRFVKAGCHDFAVEWRSPTGAPVTISGASIVVDHRPARTDERCGTGGPASS